jgi:hypothetical protein
VAGVLDLAPALKGTVSPGGVIFLFARAVGVDSGPPLAVKRMVASSFPMPFELSSADSMMGSELPDKIRLEVRLDGDGNAMSKDPSDPQAVLEEVAVGSDALHLVLSR